MNIFVKLSHDLVSSIKFIFVLFVPNLHMNLSMSLLIKSSIKMVNDLNLGVGKNGSLAGLDFQTHDDPKL